MATEQIGEQSLERRISEISGQIDQTMARIEERTTSPFEYLSGISLVRRGNDLKLILFGSGRREMAGDRLTTFLSLYWPHYANPDQEGKFLGMEVLPLMLGDDGFTEELLEKVKSFVGSDGLIEHTVGYDFGLKDRLDPEYQRAMAELKVWYGQGLGCLITEMGSLSNDSIRRAWKEARPVSSLTGGFTDARLKAFVDLASDRDRVNRSPLRVLIGFVSQRLVGSSGHPLEEEVFGRAKIADVQGNPPYGLVRWADKYLEKNWYGLDRAIIFGLKIDLMTLLAPADIRLEMMKNMLKGADANVAGQILWYEAIRKLILEYQAQFGPKG